MKTTKFKESKIEPIVVKPNMANLKGVILPEQKKEPNETMFVLMDLLKKRNQRIEKLEAELEAAQFDAKNNFEALRECIKESVDFKKRIMSSEEYQRDLERTNERLSRENEENKNLMMGMGVKVDSYRATIEQCRETEASLNKEIAELRAYTTGLRAFNEHHSSIGAAYEKIPRWIRTIYAK